MLSQTLTEWTQESKTPLHSFAVCSDSDIGKKRKSDDDTVQTFMHELRYYELTGKPLGITGEIGECLAAKHLNLDLAPARSAGYDAIDRETGELIQIKARKLADTNNRKTGRVGAIKLDHEWHTTLLVILDDRFEAVSIYKAPRDKLEEAILKPGSKSRARGALGITQFIRIAEKVWPG